MMNAKELRKAAERLVAYSTPSMVKPYPPEINKTVKAADEDVLLIARHVLATVRDDDDEPVTYEKLCSIKKPYMENRKIWWNFDGFTVSVNSSGARFHCNHMPIASAQTMGQFRSLCRGLGIELKEVERVD